MSRTLLAWIAGVVGTVAAAAIAASWMLVGGDRAPLLIGATTDGHHQFESACETCHAAPAFADAAEAEAALNQTCRDCHEDELRDADDSHPRSRFRDPRMAVYREALDARLCTACHVEHRPEITRPGAVTVAGDFCVACHFEGEQDVRAARPSHADLAFDTCASAGCHNYHDNRALYADFLVRHAGQPWLADAPVHGLSARHTTRERDLDNALGADEAIAPANSLADTAAVADWAGSAHAAAGVNCAGCHAPEAAEDATPDEVGTQWTRAPDTAVCTDCHAPQASTFVLGRHGMRRHPLVSAPRDPRRGLEALGLSALVPDAVSAMLADPARPERMTVSEARLPMRSDAAGRVLDCGTCHEAHAVDVERAAVQACASCHDDPHTRAYFGGPHHERWRAELAGDQAGGTGVSCATCHMPKVTHRGEVVTNHNQNATLRPGSKMIRSVCLDCHGLGFAIDALADDGLVTANFRGEPDTHVESIDWALRHAGPGTGF